MERVIKPALRSATRSVVGRYTPEQLYSTKRDAIQDEIFTETKKILSNQYIQLNEVLVRDVTLPPTIKSAIEQKLKQEQESLEYEFRLENSSGIIIIDNSESEKIHINIRYDFPFDESFAKYSCEGHYRCEIFKGKIIYEGLPSTSDYKAIVRELKNAILKIDQNVFNIIQNAFLQKKNEIHKF